MNIAEAWSANTHFRPLPNWIAIDLGRAMQVTSLVTKGRDSVHNQWVTLYSLDSSLDGEVWTPIENPVAPGSFLFEGNFDRNTERQYNLNTFTRFFRLNVQDYHAHPSLRWGVFACEGEIPKNVTITYLSLHFA